MIDDVPRQNWSTLLSPLLRPEPSDMNGHQDVVVRATLTHFRLRLIDHERRHLIEEFPKNLLGRFRQCSFSESAIHQAHPSIAGRLIYRERRMPRAQAWMASLFDVIVRPPKPTDQEISEALLSTREILRCIHRPQEIILGDLAIEGSDQASETFRTNHGINFEFLHLLSSNSSVRVEPSFWKCWKVGSATSSC